MGGTGVSPLILLGMVADRCGASNGIQAIGRAGTLMGRRKAPKAAGRSAREERRSHPWADWQARLPQVPSAVSNRTRPMSWLGPALSGAHPRTKGTRCFTGGLRDRTPSSPKSLLASRAQGTRRPFGSDVEIADQQVALT